MLDSEMSNIEDRENACTEMCEGEVIYNKKLKLNQAK